MKKEVQGQAKNKVNEKKYTPPTLTVYGKLTEITAAGSIDKPEGTGAGNLGKKP